MLVHNHSSSFPLESPTVGLRGPWPVLRASGGLAHRRTGTHSPTGCFFVVKPTRDWRRGRRYPGTRNLRRGRRQTPVHANRLRRPEVTTMRLKTKRRSATPCLEVIESRPLLSTLIALVDYGVDLNNSNDSKYYEPCRCLQRLHRAARLPGRRRRGAVHPVARRGHYRRDGPGARGRVRRARRQHRTSRSCRSSIPTPRTTRATRLLSAGFIMRSITGRRWST